MSTMSYKVLLLQMRIESIYAVFLSKRSIINKELGGSFGNVF